MNNATGQVRAAGSAYLELLGKGIQPEHALAIVLEFIRAERCNCG